MSTFNGTPYPLQPLAKVAKMVGGGTPSRSRSDYFDGEIDWVTPTDLPPIGEVDALGEVSQTITQEGLDHSSAKLLPPGTVLFSSRASIGKIAITDRPCATNQGFANFLPSEAVDPWYLAFALSAGTPGIEALCGQTTFKEVSKTNLRSFEIPLPPLDEQHRIVARIRACLDRVDAVRQLRQESAEAVKAVFSAALHEIVAAIEAAPATLGDVLADTMNGRSIRATPLDSNGRVLSLAALRGLHLDVEESKPVLFDDALAEKYGIEPGDVFVSRANTREFVGLSAIAPDGDWDRVIFPDLMIRLAPHPSVLRPRYLALALRLPEVRDAVRSHAKGTSSSMVKISARSLRQVSIPLPSLADQEKIEVKAMQAHKAASALIEYQREQTDQEAALTQSVLARAFAGEL